MTSDVTTSDVTEVYSNSIQLTWTRTDRHHRVEGWVTTAMMDKYLPPAPDRIADIGGGNGRQAFALADQGYDVWLSDLTPALIADARIRDQERGGVLRSAEVADARELAWPDNHAGAALFNGPLYHLADRDDRIRAIAQAARVVRPGGVVLAQIVVRAGAVRQAFALFGVGALQLDWDRFETTGTHRDDRLPASYRSFYWSTPEDAVDELREGGLEVERLQGLDAPVPDLQQRLESEHDQHTVDAWGSLAMRLGARPEYYALSNHLMIIGRVPDSSKIR